MLTPPVTGLVFAERCVCFRHRSCPEVTERRGDVDKWTGRVDNREGLGKLPRTTVVSLGMARGWTAGFRWAVRGLAHPWSIGHRGHWGDVDWLSTPCPPRNPRHDSRFRG